MLFFHFCINFSSGFEPAFNRASSRNHTEGVCFESCHLDLTQHSHVLNIIFMTPQIFIRISPRPTIISSTLSTNIF